MALDWSNERYVRLYRPSVDHRVLCWQARVIWPLLMQEADGAGVIGARRGVAAIAKALDVPLEVVEPGIADLLADGCLVEMPGGYCIRNYVAAQTATMSDSSRKARQREVDRAVDALASAAEMNSQAGSQFGHARSRDVTEGHDASRSVTPSRAEPSREEITHTARAGGVQEPAAPLPRPAASDRWRTLALALHDRWADAGRSLAVELGLTAKVGGAVPVPATVDRILAVIATWAGEAMATDRELEVVADERMAHLLAVRGASARAERSVQWWAAPTFWAADSIERDLARDPKRAAVPRDGPRRQGPHAPAPPARTCPLRDL